MAERKDIAIQSAGLSAGRGLPASQHAILALSEEGVDLMNFRASRSPKNSSGKLRTSS